MEELNTCGHVTLGTRTVEPNPELGETTTKFKYSGVTEVDMMPCAEKRPFVCEKPTISQMMSENKVNCEYWFA